MCNNMTIIIMIIKLKERVRIGPGREAVDRDLKNYSRFLWDVFSSTLLNHLKVKDFFF